MIHIGPPGSTRDEFPLPGDHVFYAANESEWVACEAERTGRTVEFRTRCGWGGFTPWKRGEVVSTMFYDGVSARIREPDPDDVVEWRVHPELGDEIRWAK